MYCHAQKYSMSIISGTRQFIVGLALLDAARKTGKGVTIDIARNGQQLFHFSMQGTSRDNDVWVQRKNNVVNRFGHSSFYMGISFGNNPQKDPGRGDTLSCIS